MKLILLTVFLTLSLFGGFLDSLSDIGTNISDNVKKSLIKEELLKVGVNNAYITQQADAKSKIVQAVKFDEELTVIQIEDNDHWFKVLTSGREGFIPVNAMIEKSALNELGNGLTQLWGTVNKNKENQETNQAKAKGWSENEDGEVHAKGFGEKTIKTKSKNRYNQEYITKVFQSLNKTINYKNIEAFRKSGGLN